MDGINCLGNVGVLTGPPFFAAIAAYMNGTNQLAIQGVDYDASVEGFLAGGSATGAATMFVFLSSFLPSLLPSQWIDIYSTHPSNHPSTVSTRSSN